MEEMPKVREARSRIVFRGLSDPFDMLTPWPVEDETVEVIDVGLFVAHLPHGDPRLEIEDGFVHFMRESWRALMPGGILTITAPAATASYSVADPQACRFFNEGSFLHFARPAIKEPEDWKWGRYGKDFGTRFVMVNIAPDESTVVATLEKPDA